jgi:two-component system chemotaxis sensor kinase CheA
MSLKKRFITGFAAVVVLSVAVDASLVRTIQRLNGMVRSVYDQSLMASTFAQSAKYDFAKFDFELHEGLDTGDAKVSATHLAKAKEMLSTFDDDLKVVVERTDGQKGKDLAQTIAADLAKSQVILADITKEMTAKGPSAGARLLETWRAAPVRASIDDKLTTLTDLQAESGFNLREASEKQNADSLKKAYGFVAGVILLSVLISVLLLRAIITPLLSLTKACAVIAEGRYDVRVESDATAEIGTVVAAFNHMIHQVGQKDANIRSLLSGMTDAIFFFGQDGKLSKERSRATDDTFPGFEACSTIDQFLQIYADQDRVETMSTVTMLWDTSIQLDFKDLAALLPQSTLISKGTPEERHVTFRYREQRDQKGKLEKIVVIARDITAEMRAKRRSEALSERVERIGMVVADSNAYQGFLGEAGRLFKALSDDLANLKRIDLAVLKRNLHSLKGGLALFEFKACAHEVHRMEDLLAEEPLEVCGPKLAQQLPGIEKKFRELNDDISKVMGLERERGMLLVARDKIHRLRSSAEAKDYRTLAETLQLLDHRPLGQLMEKYRKYVSTLSERLGDRGAELKVDSRSCEVTAEEVGRLDTVLGHLLRNALDHGIETRDDRKAAGKNQDGIITVLAERISGGALKLKIDDDGSGIDTARLAAKALSKGLWNEAKAKNADESQKINLIFAEDLSTKDAITETSGRGVGMGAVKSDLEAMGGSITVATKKGRGTTFTIQVPSASAGASLKAAA